MAKVRRKKTVGKDFRKGSILMDWAGRATSQPSPLSDEHLGALVLSTLSVAGTMEANLKKKGRRFFPHATRLIAQSLSNLGFESQEIAMHVKSYRGVELYREAGAAYPVHKPTGAWSGYCVLYVPAAEVLFDPLFGYSGVLPRRFTDPVMMRLSSPPAPDTTYGVKPDDEYTVSYTPASGGAEPSASATLKAELDHVDGIAASQAPHLRETYEQLLKIPRS